MTTEDHQPNEVFKNPKGRAIIPSIRSSQPPKWQTASRGIQRRGGAPRRAQWNPAYTQSKRIQSSSNDKFPDHSLSDYTRESSQQYTRQSVGRSNDFPRPIHAPRSRAHDIHSAPISKPPSLAIPPAKGAIKHAPDPLDCTYTYCGSSQLAPATSENGGSLNNVKRRTREWELKENGTIKKRKAKAKPVVREMEIELPEGCRKGAPNRSRFKSHFLNDVRVGMRRTVGAEILFYKFTDTHLIISYNPPDQNATNCFDTPSNPSIQAINASGLQTETIYEGSRSTTSMEATSSWKGSNEFPNRLYGSSGSNVKLEDLYATSYRHNTAGAGSTTNTEDPSINGAYTSISEALSVSNVDLGDLCKSIHALVTPGNGCSGPSTSPSQSFLHKAVTSHPQVEVVRDTPRQISKRPRKFRSGTIILSYGPSLSPDPAAPPPQEHDSSLSEVIELDDTPPPSPRRKISYNDENNTTVCRTPSPSITDEIMEEETKLEPESQTEVFLEEETSTVTHLPRASGDKPRRLLISYSQDRIYSASMHGSIQEIVRKTRRYMRELYTPPNADKEAVEDVSLFAPPFDNIAVVAQAHEDNALSLLHLGDHEGNRRTIIARTSVDQDRHRRGVSAVAALPSSGSSLSFVSAGYDHAMHLWSFDRDSISDEQPPIAGILDFQHTSIVQSLLANGNRLISGGADNCVRTWDLSAARQLSTIRTSNSVFQLHRTAQPESILVEVGHRDSQFELHDCRLSEEGQPPLRFGYPSVQGAQGRFARGVVDPQDWNTFVSGGRDGMVRVWDLRNVNQCKQEIMCFPGQRIVHAAFAWDNLVVASEDNRLLFFDLLRS